jgi:hypothetical protein
MAVISVFELLKLPDGDQITAYCPGYYYSFYLDDTVFIINLTVIIKTWIHSVLFSSKINYLF